MNLYLLLTVCYTLLPNVKLANHLSDGNILETFSLPFRGGGGPSCFAMRQSATTPNKCTFQWLLNTDVKINLPRFIIENAIVTSQIEFISNLRAKVARLTKELGLDR